MPTSVVVSEEVKKKEEGDGGWRWADSSAGLVLGPWLSGMGVLGTRGRLWELASAPKFRVVAVSVEGLLRP